jgi:hypothetical protein
MEGTMSGRTAWRGRAVMAVGALALAAMAGCAAGMDDGAATQTPSTRPGGGIVDTLGTGPAATEPPGTLDTTTTESTTALPPPPPPPASKAAGAAPAPPPAPARASARPGSPGCPNVEIVSARGTTEPQSGSFIMGALNQGIAAQTGAGTYQVVYPASGDFVNSPNVGVSDALAHMHAKAAQCANTRFFLTGYSQGAMVVTRVLQSPGDLGGRLAGGVLYGNPYYKGTSPTAAGPDKAAAGLVPGSGIPALWGGKVRDYCYNGDTVCGSKATGGSHLSYRGSPSEREAIAWAAGLLRG